MKRHVPALLLATLFVVMLVALLLTHDASAARPRPWTKNEVHWLVRFEFGTGALERQVWCIVGRETGYTYNPRTHNWRDVHADGSRGSHGLAQIGSLWRARGETVAHFARRMENPVLNLRLAHWIIERHGLEPWGGRC